MNLILFGATGMVGQGALIECLDDPGVKSVLAVVRRATGKAHPKLRELILPDFTDYSSVEAELRGYDGALFCLGVSASGMSEADYRHITLDYAMAAATVLCRLNPEMRFIYVSGQGTDSSEKGRLMWARIKGHTENELMKLPFKAYMFRPGYIQPVKGVVSSTTLYRMLYSTLGLAYPLWKALAPGAVTTSAILGRAMIRAVAEAGPTRIVDVPEINRLGASTP